MALLVVVLVTSVGEPLGYPNWGPKTRATWWGLGGSKGLLTEPAGLPHSLAYPLEATGQVEGQSLEAQENEDKKQEARIPKEFEKDPVMIQALSITQRVSEGLKRD